MQSIRNYEGTKDKKGWFRAIILVIAWILIFSLVRDLNQVKKGFGRIEETEKRLEEEKTKNLLLQDKLRLVATDEYRERMIREQLNMQKMGEVVVVLPSRESILPNEERGEELPKKNWQKWWALLK